MNSEQFQKAWKSIEQSWQNGQLAHAYLLVGAPHGAARRFADKLLNLIFDNHPQVALRTHPDILWIEPESKSRQIKISQIRPTPSERRENIVERFSTTSFSGGWKVGVILCADRMNTQAANALLKTLEEPPARSLLLLISDEPQSLLPTISSRCQRIALTMEDEELTNQWKEPLLNILSELPPTNAPQAGLLTGRVTGILKTLQKEIEEEEQERIPEDMTVKEAKALLDGRVGSRMVEIRTDVLRTMLKWQRDVLMLVLNQAPLHFAEHKEALERQAATCTRAEALKRIRAVEESARQLDRNLPAELVFESFLHELT